MDPWYNAELFFSRGFSTLINGIDIVIFLFHKRLELFLTARGISHKGSAHAMETPQVSEFDGHAKVLRSVQPQVYRGRLPSASQLACSSLLAGGERRDRNAIVAVANVHGSPTLLRWANDINAAYHWGKESGDEHAKNGAVQSNGEREFVRGIRELRVDAVLSRSIITALQEASAPEGQNCCAAVGP